MQTKATIFLTAILLHSKDPKKVKSLILNDKRLTLAEKKIIQGFLLIRSNKNEDALSLAEEIISQEEPFVESMRFFLLGSTLNNLGQYDRALMFFKSSDKFMPKEKSSHLEYSILNNIYHVYLNLI